MKIPQGSDCSASTPPAPPSQTDCGLTTSVVGSLYKDQSPCTSTPSVYNTFETAEQRDEWLEAIARDDLHDERLFLNAAARGELRDPAFDEMLDEQERDCEAQRIKDLEEV